MSQNPITIGNYDGVGQMAPRPIGYDDGSGNVARVSANSPLPIGTLDTDYETVAESQTDQVLGTTGAAGDQISGVLIVPSSTSPGAVSIKDGNGSGITIFAGGATSLPSLAPVFVPLGMRSTSGAWKLTTGANLSAIAIGNFT